MWFGPWCLIQIGFMLILLLCLPDTFTFRIAMATEGATLHDEVFMDRPVSLAGESKGPARSQTAHCSATFLDSLFSAIAKQRICRETPWRRAGNNNRNSWRSSLTYPKTGACGIFPLFASSFYVFVISYARTLRKRARGAQIRLIQREHYRVVPLLKSSASFLREVFIFKGTGKKWR